jgi:predicted Rossmann-fold nucleotide-binding protein
MGLIVKVAVIGPSNINRVARAAGVSADRIKEMAAGAGRLLAAAGHELVVCPDQGVPVIAAEAYRAAGGKKVQGLIPTSGDSASGSLSRVQRNTRLCDEFENDLTWYEQHSRLIRAADALICLGLSCGTICEIAWTKWTKRVPVFVLKGLGSAVPPEVEAETDVRYLDSLSNIIAALEREK